MLDYFEINYFEWYVIDMCFKYGLVNNKKNTVIKKQKKKRS